MISAIIGVLVLFATQRAFPEFNERFKSFSSIGFLLLAGAFAVSTFNGIFFYAEPGFKYHVRTITGQEKMVSDTGYDTYVFGAGDGDTPTGGDQEAQLLQQLLAMEYAKRLDYDRAIQK